MLKIAECDQLQLYAMEQKFNTYFHIFARRLKKNIIHSHMCCIEHVSTAVVGIELTTRRLRDGCYTIGATAETMRERGWKGGAYCPEINVLQN